MRHAAGMAQANRAVGARAFGLFALAWTLAVSILLVRDPRPTLGERTVLGVAVVFAFAALALGVSRSHRSRQGALVGAVGLTGCALLTYRVGGLAYLVSAFFFLVAWAATTLRESSDLRMRARRKWIARTLLIVAVILIPLSMLDPGGAAVIVVPVLVPLAVWAIAAL